MHSPRIVLLENKDGKGGLHIDKNPLASFVLMLRLEIALCGLYCFEFL